MKELSLIITFNNTTDAIASEACCRKASITARLIPLPTVISAGCGMSLKTSLDARESVVSVLSKEGVSYSGIYQMII